MTELMEQKKKELRERTPKAATSSASRAKGKKPATFEDRMDEDPHSAL